MKLNSVFTSIVEEGIEDQFQTLKANMLQTNKKLYDD